MKKRLLSLALALVMVTALIVPVAMAEIPSTPPKMLDTSTLEGWEIAGVLKGNAHGDKMLDKPITRGELATIVDRIMGYPAISKNPFTDTMMGAWYAQGVLGANAAQVLLGSGDAARPGDTITRQEVLTVLARMISLQTEKAPDAGFSDREEIAAWAVPSVNAMVRDGYLKNTGEPLDPLSPPTRGEIFGLLSAMIPNYCNAPGRYTGKVKGNVLISSDNVTIQKMTIDGNLIVADGVKAGTILITGTTVKGNLLLQCGDDPKEVTTPPGNQKTTGISPFGPQQALGRTGDLPPLNSFDPSDEVIYMAVSGDSLRLEHAIAKNLQILSKFGDLSMFSTGYNGTVSVLSTKKTTLNGAYNEISADASGSQIVLNGTAEKFITKSGESGITITVGEYGIVGALELGAKNSITNMQGSTKDLFLKEGADGNEVNISGFAQITHVSSSDNQVNYSMQGAAAAPQGSDDLAGKPANDGSRPFGPLPALGRAGDLPTLSSFDPSGQAPAAALSESTVVLAVSDIVLPPVMEFLDFFMGPSSAYEGSMSFLRNKVLKLSTITFDGHAGADGQTVYGKNNEFTFATKNPDGTSIPFELKPMGDDSVAYEWGSVFPPITKNAGESVQMTINGKPHNGADGPVMLMPVDDGISKPAPKNFSVKTADELLNAMQTEGVTNIKIVAPITVRPADITESRPFRLQAIHGLTIGSGNSLTVEEGVTLKCLGLVCLEGNAKLLIRGELLMQKLSGGYPPLVFGNDSVVDAILEIATTATANIKDDGTMAWPDEASLPPRTYDWKPYSGKWIEQVEYTFPDMNKGGGVDTPD